MHLGIIVYSQSGHTASAAKAIAEKFREHGHEVDIKLLLTTGMARPGSKHFTICNSPEQEDVDQWDAVVVGSPVWGFRESIVMREFLTWLNKLNGKKALSFVTMASPWKSLGGNQAIHNMNEDLRASGGNVLPGEILRYFFGFNKKQLQEVVGRIYLALTA